MNQPNLASSSNSPLSDHLHRLHWSSLLFDAISQIRRIILPAAFGLLGAARGDVFWLWLSMAFFIPTLLVSFFRYITLSYQVDQGQLVVKHGLIFRNVRSVPVERIQNIDFVQNLLHRVFGVAEVRVETAGGSEPEATLRVLSLEKVELLRAAVFESRDLIQSRSILDQLGATALSHGNNYGQADLATASEDSFNTTPVIYGNEAGVPLASLSDGHPRSVASESESTVLEIPTGWLIKAGLASDRGVLLVGVAIGFMYESNILKRLDFNKLLQFLPKNPGVWMVAAGILTAFLVLYLVLKLLSAIWYVIRFSGYRLVRRKEDLRISCGLTTKVHATVPRSRIQFISVHRGWMMRLLGYCSVRIETASSGSSHEDASKSVSSRWFIPVVAENLLPEILEQVRPGIDWNENAFDFKPVSARAVRRRLRIIVLLGVLLVTGLLIAWQPWFALGAGVVSFALAVGSVLSIRSLGFARTDQGVVFRSGVISKIVSMTFFEKIQAVTFDQSPMDRRWRMAKLTVDTAAAGPAEHRIDVPLLDQDFAEAEMATITSLAAKHQPIFR